MEKFDKITLLRKMIRIRLFEEKSVECHLKGKIKGMLHCTTGQEAVDVGTCTALDESDYVIGNHRPHGIMIAKGADVNLLMAEMYGKSSGTNGGKGGSMHLFDKSIGSLGSTAIVGSGLPLACGAAFASNYKKDGKITCVFFGDGAANEGTFHESMNLASKWKLPIIFLLINNGVAITTLLENVTLNSDLYQRAQPYGICSKKIDGQSVEDVYSSVKSAIAHIKSGKGPALIEAKTFRFNEHAEGAAYARLTDTGYRDRHEVDNWIANKDPIKLYAKKLIEGNFIRDSEIRCIYDEEKHHIEKAIIFAEGSPFPKINEAYSNVFI